MSFGHNGQFDDCGLNFLSQMSAACRTLYPIHSGPEIDINFKSIRGATCVSQVTFVYGAVRRALKAARDMRTPESEHVFA